MGMSTKSSDQVNVLNTSATMGGAAPTSMNVSGGLGLFANMSINDAKTNEQTS